MTNRLILSSFQNTLKMSLKARLNYTADYNGGGLSPASVIHQHGNECDRATTRSVFKAFYDVSKSGGYHKHQKPYYPFARQRQNTGI